MDESQARQLICEIGKLLYERSYVVSSDGNVSIRLDENTVLATPTMTCKGRMTEDDLALTDMEGKPLTDKRASSELAMHLLIYRERPEIKAVCHAHPPHGTAFAVAGLAIDKPILSEVILTLGCVPLTDYGTPSTDELTEAMRPFVKHHNALLMANHGVVTYGATIEEAFNRMDTVEHFAKISIYTKILGRERLLSSQDVEKLWVQRQKYFGLDSPDMARPKDPMCPLTDGVSDTISITRSELIDLIEKVVSNLK